jgi:RNase P subunit RPR2
MTSCTKCGGALVLDTIRSSDDAYDCLILNCSGCGIIVDKQFMKRSKDETGQD